VCHGMNLCSSDKALMVFKPIVGVITFALKHKSKMIAGESGSVFELS